MSKAKDMLAILTEVVGVIDARGLDVLSTRTSITSDDVYVSAHMFSHEDSVGVAAVFGLVEEDPYESRSSGRVWQHRTWKGEYNGARITVTSCE